MDSATPTDPPSSAGERGPITASGPPEPGATSPAEASPTPDPPTPGDGVAPARAWTGADRPVCVIVNPAAGGGRAAEAQGQVEAEMRRLGMRVRSERATSLEDAARIATAAAANGEVVATLGGDGLIGAVADALRWIEGSVLGVLPGGRGNDLVRVLGVPADPVAACGVVARGHSRAIDLGEAEGRAFVGIASVGFDSDANRIANEAPPKLGKLVYAYGALLALTQWKPAQFEVLLEGADGAVVEGEEDEQARAGTALVTFSGYTVALASSKAYGGGMMLAPGARLDDGLLDVVCIANVPRARFLASLPRVFTGSHVELDSVMVRRAREVLVSADRQFTVYADGDPIGELPLRIRALPRAIRVLVPGGGT